MKKVIIGKKNTTDDGVEFDHLATAKVIEKDGDMVYNRSASERLTFTSEKALETYFKRRHRKANYVKVVSEGEFPKHISGNNWELSSGEKITGKDEAQRLEYSREQ